MVYRFETCCFGCTTLKIGTIIIGILCILGNAVGMIMLPLADYEWNEYLQKPYVVLVIVIFILLLVLIAAALMIVGAVMEIWKFIIPWLIANGIATVVFLIARIALSIERFISEDATNGSVYILTGILECVVRMCLWYVPFSHVLELQEEHNEQ